MAKKKTKNLLGMLLPMVAALLAVISVCMLAVTAVQRVGTLTTVSYTGAQVTFGYKEANTGAQIFSFSFMNFLPYILLVAGLVFSVLAVLGKLGKFAPIVAAACYLVAGILFFCANKMVVYPTDSKDAADALREGLSLGAGAIVAGILSVLAALSSAATLFVKK